jgi:hypothetical protein
MYDFSQHTFSGESVAYASLPNYLLDLIDADSQLTPTAKLIYFRLLRYAAYKKQTTFIITIAWLTERLSLNRKTVAAGLLLLKSSGYLTDEGILIPAPTKTKKVARKTSYLSSQQQKQVKVADLSPVVATPEPVVQSVVITPPTAAKTPVDASVMQNLLLAVGSIKKVKTPQTDVPILPIVADDVGKKVAADVPILPIECPKNSHPIITIQNNKQKNNNQQSVSVQHRKSGMTKMLPHKTQAYIESALIRMKAGTAERERYLDEICYSVTQGAFASNDNPLKSVRACLNIIERGDWRPPVGMY